MESTSSQPAPASRPSSLRWKDVLRILLALVLIALVFSKTDLEQVRAISRTVSWTWLAANLVLYCSMTALKAVQYWALMERRVPYKDVLRIVVIQNGLTNLVATTAGIASYLTLFRMEQNVRVSRSGVVFVITKVGDVLSMAFFLLASSLFVWGRVGILHEVILLILAAIFLAFIVFLTALFLRQTFVIQIERFLHWARLERFAWMRNGLDTLRSLASQEQSVVLRTLLTGMLLSFGYIAVTMLYSYTRVQAFHVPIDLWPIIFIAVFVQLVSMVPVQAFGGLGWIEFTSVYLYGIFGIMEADIAAVLIGMRVAFYLFNLVTLLYLPLDALLRRTVWRRSP